MAVYSSVNGFKITNPQGFNILIREISGVDTIIAATITVNDCNGYNASSTLSQLTSVAFTLGGTTTVLTLTNAKLEGTTHYSYSVVDNEFDTSSLSPNPTTTCINLDTDPDINSGFRNSDFDVLQGEASSIRLSSDIYEVDRKENQVFPSNIDAINSQTAQLAEVQDSNYESKKWSTPRYIGSKIVGGKVLVDDPALQFRSFSAAIFPSGSSTNFILTSSLNSTIEDEQKATLYFTPGRVSGVKNNSGSAYLDQNNIQAVPENGQKIYEEQGNLFLPFVNERVFSLDYEIIYNVDDKGFVVKEPSTDPNLGGADVTDPTQAFCYAFTNASQAYYGTVYFTGSAHPTNTQQETLAPGETYYVTVSGSLYRTQGGDIRAATYGYGACPSILEDTFSGGQSGD